MPKKTPLGGMRASTNGEPSPRCTGNALTISASRPTRLFRSSRCLKRRIITSRSDEKGDVRRMTQTPGEPPSPAKPVSAGQDQFGEHRGLGVSRVDFKVAGQGRDGLLVLENTFHTKGGPARHLHVAQDEWFYVIEGRFVIEVGDKRFALNAGDSVLAPRQVPHVWAHVGEAHGKILITFRPGGDMEAFFRE